MRVVRLLWIVLFVLPLGFFADRLCYIDLVDPSYHALLWMHEHIGYLFAGLAVVFAGVAFARFVRIQGQLGALDTLRSPTPAQLNQAFARAAAQCGVRTFDLLYVDVPMVFCFTVFGGRIVISRGFADLLSARDLELVAAHEMLHLRGSHPFKALVWHLFFAALIVPGLEPLEDALYQRREWSVDNVVRQSDHSAYDALLARFKSTMCNSAPAAAFRAAQPTPTGTLRSLAPTALPLALLVLLTASHVFFVQNLPYLQAHHC